MRVLFYSSIFPRPWNATLGIYCLQACRAMQELGHRVRVVSPRSFLEREGARVNVPGLSEVDVVYPRYVYPPRVMQAAYHRFMALSSRQATRAAMRDLCPDAVLSYWAHPDGAVAARFARSARIPSGVIVGGSDVLVLAREPGARRRSVVRALEANDAIITVGRNLADAVEALGIRRAKIHVVHQGVDETVFHPGSRSASRAALGLPEKAPVLVTVGSLVAIKGIDVLLAAVPRLLEQHPELLLCLVGDGASRKEYEAQAARLGIAKAVRFVGKVEQPKLGAWYRAADLTVLSSRSEGVPNVLRESLACGTPFVATRVGGVEEIAEGTSNRLVAPEDPAALASAITASLRERRSEGAAAEVPAGILSWKASTERLLAVLEGAGRR